MKKFILFLASCISFSTMHAGIASYSWTAFSWTFGTVYSALSTLHSTFGLYTNKEFQKHAQIESTRMQAFRDELKAQGAQTVEQHKAEVCEKINSINGQLEAVQQKIIETRGLLKEADRVQAESFNVILLQLKTQQEALQAQLSKQLQEREEQFKTSLTQQLNDHKAVLSTTNAQLKEEIKELEATLGKNILDLKIDFGSRWEKQHANFLAGLAARAQKINEIAEKRQRSCKKDVELQGLQKEFMDAIRS